MTEIAQRLDGARDRLRAEAAAASDYLTIEEVARLARRHQKTVRRAIAAGWLPAFRLTGGLLVREHDARAWIEGQPVEVRTERPRPRPSARRRSQTASVATLKAMESEGTR